jgi:hypothetical protein
MREESITLIICLVVGLSLILFPRPIAHWFCSYIKNLWKLHGNDWFAKGCEGAVWMIERVSFGKIHDEATAPKAFRLAGFMYLWIALMFWLDLFVL